MTDSRSVTAAASRCIEELSAGCRAGAGDCVGRSGDAPTAPAPLLLLLLLLLLPLLPPLCALAPGEACLAGEPLRPAAPLGGGGGATPKVAPGRQPDGTTALRTLPSGASIAITSPGLTPAGTVA